MAHLPEHARDMFCFAVYAATHAISRTYAPLLKPLDLTYPQYIALTLLWEKDDQSVGEIASQMGMETSTMTPLLKRLEKLGHVTRNRGKADERQVFVSLTQDGWALKAKAGAITSCMIEETGFELSELDGLVSGLTRLRRNLEAKRTTASAKAAR